MEQDNGDDGNNGSGGSGTDLKERALQTINDEYCNNGRRQPVSNIFDDGGHLPFTMKYNERKGSRCKGDEGRYYN